MYKAKRTGFFTLACQSRQVRLVSGQEIPSGIPADSIKRFLETGAIEKVVEKDFVKETKDSKPSKTEKPSKGQKNSEKDEKVNPDAPSDEPVE